MSAAIVTTFVLSILGRTDEIGLLRVDPAAPGAPLALELYSQSVSGADALQALTKFDPKIGKTAGKKVVRHAFGFDHDGDGHDEILVATEATTLPGRPLIVKIHRAPASPTGDLGAPIASLKSGAFKLEGPDRVIALCAIEFDDDARDELCVIRGGEPPMSGQRLEVYDFPTGKNKKLGGLLASDWTFGAPGAECVALAAADSDLDGRDELLVLRRAAGGNESLELVAPPAYPIGEAATLAADASITAADAAPIEAAFAIRRNGPLEYQLALLRRSHDGQARLDIHPGVSASSPELLAPIASEGPLDGEGIGDRIAGAFVVEHDQKLPWDDFVGPVNAFFRIVYPIGEDEFVSTWVGPVPGLLGEIVSSNEIEFGTGDPTVESVTGTAESWDVGSTVSFEPWNLLRLDVTKPVGTLLVGQWIELTLLSSTIESASVTKKRLRYSNPGVPTDGLQCGLVWQNIELPTSYSGPGMGGDGPPAPPPTSEAIATVMEFYLEKP